MTRHDDLPSAGRARLSFASDAEIDEFAATLARFERGEITPDEWRAFRLARGTYGQRQSGDAQMVRVKVPQGLLTARQMDVLADVADRYSRGFGHITTRQNVQFHFVALHDVEPVMRVLSTAGLTTREACGSAIRNVTTCVLSGVSASEAFDVTPYAEALTRHFLRHPLASALPRKFKIAFEGCGEDHVKAAINDIAWQARIVGGRRGFRVRLGGGTATMAVTARTLSDFVPVEHMLHLAEAVVRVFHARGDFVHRARNRMKFLIRSMGWEAFAAEVNREFEAVRATDRIRLPFNGVPPEEAPPLTAGATLPAPGDLARLVRGTVVRGPGLRPDLRLEPAPAPRDFERWQAASVAAQKQPGFRVITVGVPLGDLTAGQWRALAGLASTVGDGTVRLTPAQNLVIRWVPEHLVEPLFVRLSAIGLGGADADSMADPTSCPGAESCKLAVTQSRGLGQAVSRHLAAHPDLVAAARAIDVKVSGCPNGCGQHHVAAVGFQGSLRKVGGRAVPQYFVSVGGGVGADGATFGRLVAKVPARRAPAALERLARLYVAERRPAESASAFFSRVDAARLTALLADLSAISPDTATAEDYVDHAETEPFRPELQEGECIA